MVSWIPLSPKFCPKPLELIEYFSGAARISRWAHAKGFEVRAFDSDYDKPLPGGLHFHRASEAECFRHEWRSGIHAARCCFFSFLF